MKRSVWCRLFGCRLIIVRAGFPLQEQWFVRCRRKHCNVRTVTVDGSPWGDDLQSTINCRCTLLYVDQPTVEREVSL